MAKKLKTFTDDRQVQKYEAKKENKKRSLQRKVKRGDWIK